MTQGGRARAPHPGRPECAQCADTFLTALCRYLDSVTTKPFYFWGSQRYAASNAAAKADASAALRLSSEFAVVPLFKVGVQEWRGPGFVFLARLDHCP